MNNLKKLVLCFGTLSLVGCMDTATRLWNSGPYISNKEREAHKTCFSEIKLSDPKLYNSIESRNYSMDDSIRFDRVIDECMKKKDFKALRYLKNHIMYFYAIFSWLYGYSYATVE